MSACQMLSAGKIVHGAALDAAGELGARPTVFFADADADADAVGLAGTETVAADGIGIREAGRLDSDALELCAPLHDESRHTAATAPAIPLP